jgi:hypothetical protein
MYCVGVKSISLALQLSWAQPNPTQLPVNITRVSLKTELTFSKQHRLLNAKFRNCSFMHREQASKIMQNNSQRLPNLMPCSVTWSLYYTGLERYRLLFTSQRCSSPTTGHCCTNVIRGQCSPEVILARIWSWVIVAQQWVPRVRTVAHQWPSVVQVEYSHRKNATDRQTDRCSSLTLEREEHLKRTSPVQT